MADATNVLRTELLELIYLVSRLRRLLVSF